MEKWKKALKVLSSNQKDDNCDTSIKKLILDGNSLSTEKIAWAAENFEIKAEITETVSNRIEASHQLLKKLVENNRVIYGVNTSMGGFVNWLIPTQYAQELQENLIAAVATNVGPYLEIESCALPY